MAKVICKTEVRNNHSGLAVFVACRLYYQIIITKIILNLLMIYGIFQVTSHSLVIIKNQIKSGQPSRTAFRTTWSIKLISGFFIIKHT